MHVVILNSAIRLPKTHIVNGKKQRKHGMETQALLTALNDASAEIAGRVPGAKITQQVFYTKSLEKDYARLRKEAQARGIIPAHLENFQAYVALILQESGCDILLTRNMGPKSLQGPVGNAIDEFAQAGGTVCNPVSAAAIAKNKWATYLQLGGKEYIRPWEPGMTEAPALSQGQLRYIHSQRINFTARLPAWDPKWNKLPEAERQAIVLQIYRYYTGAEVFGGPDLRGAFVLKPSGGSKGNGVMKCDLAGDPDKALRKFEQALRASTKEKPYLIQELIHVSPLDSPSLLVQAGRALEREQRALHKDAADADPFLAQQMRELSALRIGALEEMARAVRKGGQDIRVFVTRNEKGQPVILSRTVRIAAHQREFRSNLSLGGNALRLVSADDPQLQAGLLSDGVPTVVLPPELVAKIDAAAIDATVKLGLDYAGVDVAVIRPAAHPPAARVIRTPEGGIAYEVENRSDYGVRIFEVNAFPGFKGASVVWRNVGYASRIVATALGKRARELGVPLNRMFRDDAQRRANLG